MPKDVDLVQAIKQAVKGGNILVLYKLRAAAMTSCASFFACKPFDGKITENVCYMVVCRASQGSLHPPLSVHTFELKGPITG